MICRLTAVAYFRLKAADFRLKAVAYFRLKAEATGK
jgi:hypothetical protein